MAGRTDARSTMHGETRVATVDRCSLACVDPHPHLHFGLVRPGVARQRPLRLDGSEHGLVCTPERVEERVPLRVELVPAVLRERQADEPLVLGEYLRVAATELPDQPRRPLDVREEERHRAAREIRHRKKA